MGALGALIYVAFVLGISALLAGLGWTGANDVLALNKQERAAMIAVRRRIFAQGRRKGRDLRRGKGGRKVGGRLVAVCRKMVYQYKFVFKLFAS